MHDFGAEYVFHTEMKQVARLKEKPEIFVIQICYLQGRFTENNSGTSTLPPKNLSHSSDQFIVASKGEHNNSCLILATLEL